MEWLVKEDVKKQGSSDGFWYDLVYGGYIKPEEVLKDKDQLNKLKEAIETVSSFESMLEEEDLLNEF